MQRYFLMLFYFIPRVITSQQVEFREMASTREQLENSDHNRNEEFSEKKQCDSDNIEMSAVSSEIDQFDHSSLSPKRTWTTMGTQTPLTLAKIMMIKPSANDDQPTCSTSKVSGYSSIENKAILSGNSLPITHRKSSQASSSFRSEPSTNSKINFAAYRVKEMSVKLSREASTQATPPHPSLLSTKSYPASRDVLQISTSLSSESSGPKSEILTVTTDYASGSPDARSILVDVVEQNGLSARPKSFRTNANRGLQLSVHEALSVPPVTQIPLRNVVPNESRSIRICRWPLKKILKCTSTEEEIESDDSSLLGDAPPTYSSIFAEVASSASQRTPPSLARDRSSPFTAPIPPPSYAQAQGVSLAPYSMEQLISLAPTVGGIWSGRPTAAICPRCTALIFTVVEVRQSTITHVAAFLLCLFGCWPCCVLPYCINACRITEHYCPICRTYLGTYSPC